MGIRANDSADSSSSDGDEADTVSMERHRAEFLAKIESHARALAREIGEFEISRRVLEAVARVPREEFVPAHERTRAYMDMALAIGHGQTISQPFIVACMTDLLRVEKGDRVLEIGTGSGYQAAVLAELGARVFTVESIPELAESARHRLKALGYENVSVRTGDGYEGWSEHAPYRGVVVTAVADRVPEALVEQLQPGGRLVLPLIEPGGEQWLCLLEKDARGSVSLQRIFPVRFVPLRQA